LSKHIERGLSITEAFDMCDEAAGFYRKQNPEGVPSRQAATLDSVGSAVEAIIDFYGIEMTNVPAQVSLRRKFRRVEGIFPVTIVPAGSTDADAGSYGRLS
jgi:hypothetical protein